MLSGIGELMDPDQTSEDRTLERTSPKRIGRYRIVRLIGSGGYGSVLLANDEELDREVAIKIPNEGMATTAIGDYLDEARMVAKLDHPNIVPVYDVGKTEDLDYYIVSKYIPGEDLRQLLKHYRFNFLEAATLVATIADALHHAHKRGLVHRDIKPSNILIDPNGTPYVADFGLALPEQKLGKGPRFAGTPVYMSPEQARGEGHRVDGRSDIFSLGAVFYQLASGKRPFRAETRSDLLEQIEFHEPKPLRQHDEQIPKEIDRICQKALAKRANERYWSAHDLAEDIRIFMRQHESAAENPDRLKTSWRSSRKASGTRAGLLETATDHGQSSARDLSDPETAPLPNLDHDADSQSVNVIPKGLRPFDAQDADFFLELLPGPKDRDGLPNSLRFWKKRIEAKDVDDSFSVGMIYGPSGCGKSSFVNAGLIPRLSKSITPVVVESSADFTEQRILNRLHKSFPQLDPELGLSDAVASVRLGQGVPQGCKVVLILDQFERWLHSHQSGEGRELINALRQCDGERIQAILMVRSDFWMSVTRLLNDLEIDLVQGKNFAAVDLFPPRHAKKVLIAFGRAFGALPTGEELEKDNLGFVDKTVQNLAEDGKLICVRLALYAEMMKNKSWTLDSFNRIGGTEGIGVSFLDESFGPNANPKIRLHQVAARRVLKSLLPDSGTTINIQMKSYDELFQDSGYSDRKQFEELIRVLDNEMRLIARTDPSGIDLDSENMGTVASLDPAKKYFRLSHDYLVTALRKWLNRKQRETRRGRAELLLAERAAFWNAKPESRYLPSIPEHFRIRSLIPKAQWNKGEKAVMKSAAKSHGIFLAVSLAVMTALGLAGVGLKNSIQERNADQLVDNVLQAETSQVRDAVGKLESYRSAPVKLKAAFKNHPTRSREKLHAAMALASDSPEYSDYLLDQIPAVSADRLQPVCDSLNGSFGKANIELTDGLVDMLNDNSTSTQSRLQVACAMAQFDSKHGVWEDSDLRKFVAEQLTQLYPSDLAPLRKALRPVASQITPYLRDIFLDQEREQQQRLFATESLVDYATNSPQTLYELLIDCDERQFPLVFRALENEPNYMIEMATQTIAREIPAPGANANIRSRLARNQANAAVALYQLGQFDDVWPLVEEVGTDPTVRNLVIHGIWNRGSSPKPLLEKLCSATSSSMLQFAMLAIGEFPIASFDKTELDQLVSRVTDLLGKSQTAEVAASAQWLLRRIGYEQISEELVQTETKLRQDQRRTELKQLQDISDSRKLDEFANRQVAGILNHKRNFYFTGEGQMMIRLEAGSFMMGGVSDTQKQFDYAYVHERNISRIFAISAFEVTLKQWNSFLADPTSSVAFPEKFSPDKQNHPSRPVINVTWIEAVQYCNWLSEREGIPESQWCYVPHPENGYRVGMKTKSRFWELSGYRLPTQAEWEFACRAGTHTDRMHGDSEHLLNKYAWYQKNTTTPRDVGLLKPNPWGLFDMHGNAMEWCSDLHEPLTRFKDGARDFPSSVGVVTSQNRELRGGAYYDLPIYIRSSNRYSQPPEGHLASTGIRICRTLKNLDSQAQSPEQD